MFKYSLSQVTKVLAGGVLCSVSLLGHAQVEDECTAKLEKYLSTLQSNVESDYISPRQKEASQKLIDKAARLRANEEYIYTDCAVFDKLFF